MSTSPVPGRQPVIRRPTILLGSDATLLGRPMAGPARAADAGLYGIDLDLRHAWRPPGPDMLDDFGATRLRCAWLPARYTGPLAEERAGRLRAVLSRAVSSAGLRTVVVPAPDAGSPAGVSLVRIARHLAELQPVRVALGIDAETVLARSGVHLEHVAHARRVAEEWDFDIALDLTGANIGTWETEAALMRVFPRLAVVRLGALHEPDGSWAQASAATVAQRSIAMLADQAYAGLISVLPGPRPLPWLAWLTPPNVSVAGATREEILGAYDRVDHYRSPAEQPNPRPFP